MKRLLFVSNLYPNEKESGMASYNRQQVASLMKIIAIDVVAPVSWRYRSVQLWLKGTRRKNDTGRVLHPTYFYPPGVLRFLYGLFFYLSACSSVRNLVSTNRYDAIFGSWLYPDGWACLRFANELKVPLFLKVHGTDVNGLIPGHRVTRQALMAVNQARGVFCVSRALKDRLIDLGASKNNLFVVYNGVDRQIFKPGDRRLARKNLGLKEDRCYLLYVGNLKKSKGLDELIQAFAQVVQNSKVSKMELLVLGLGSWGEAFLSRAREIGVEKSVRMIGGRPHKEIAEWMNACDLLCLPSYMEGVPNVVIEAMACGIPVVASAVGGVPELGQLGGSLYLVPPREVDQLANVIERVLKCGRDSIPVEWPSWEENANLIYDLMRARL